MVAEGDNVVPDGSTVGWESALVQRARRGDARAFERLYREHSAAVYGLCLRLLLNEANAEDCTQEAFVRAWRALDRFEGRSAFGTWLHRIAVNVALKRRVHSSSREEPVEDVSEYVDASDWTFDSPVEVAEIETAIGALPPGARDSLVLCALYGYSHIEAAGMLGIAAGTCKAQLHRARKLLEQKLNRTAHDIARTQAS